jgi:hypothetical protein
MRLTLLYAPYFLISRYPPLAPFEEEQGIEFLRFGEMLGPRTTGRGYLSDQWLRR